MKRIVLVVFTLVVFIIYGTSPTIAQTIKGNIQHSESSVDMKCVNIHIEKDSFLQKIETKEEDASKMALLQSKNPKIQVFHKNYKEKITNRLDIPVDTRSKVLSENTKTVLFPSNAYQVLRGVVRDRSSQMVIPNAYIELLNYNPKKAIHSNENGIFILEDIEVGRYRILVEAKEYEYHLIDEVLVSAGKETILVIELEESTEPKIVQQENKQRYFLPPAQPINPMSLTGTRSFTIEEVSRYPGGLNDPARISANYAGIFNTDDSQNFIVSRGNTPFGSQWYIEGIPVNNPNHFARLGNTGSPIQLLNTATLANSDFHQTAFSAEYSNAFSNVFDISLRSGNNQHYEFLGQFSLLGLELMAEGPIQKGKSSFIAAYRYSVLTLVQKLNLDIGVSSLPSYQDITLKLDFPFSTKQEKLSFFLIAGTGEVDLLNKNLRPGDLFSEKNQNIFIRSNSIVTGLTHKKFINSKAYIKTMLSYTLFDYHSYQDSVMANGSTSPSYSVDNTIHTTGIFFTFNNKLNAKMLIETGFRFQMNPINIYNQYLDKELVQRNFKGILFDGASYFQWRYRLTTNLTISTGIQASFFSLNKRSFALEPRIAIHYKMEKGHSFNFGYGLHSKRTPLAMLFYVAPAEGGTYNYSNRNLGLIRNHHINFGYNIQFLDAWSITTELYFQKLYNIPVEVSSSNFSLINYGSLAQFPLISDLTGEGIARNYGGEFTADKTFYKGYYGRFAFSIFRSQYKGSDKIWRRTSFDVHRIIQLTMGKEFPFGKHKNNRFNIDFGYRHQGPRPYIPIDLDASILAGTEVLDTDNAYTDFLKPYHRIDLKIGARFNHKKKRLSHYVYLDILNIGNFDNELQKKYNADIKEIVTGYQFGIVPNIFYQVLF